MRRATSLSSISRSIISFLIFNNSPGTDFRPPTNSPWKLSPLLVVLLVSRKELFRHPEPVLHLVREDVDIVEPGAGLVRRREEDVVEF